MDETQPLLRVVRGSADPEEVAALVAVLTSMTAADSAQDETPRSRWSNPSSRMRAPQVAARDGWRSSALPR